MEFSVTIDASKLEHSLEEDVRKKMKKSLGKLEASVKKEMVASLSGIITTAQLVAMDHPFARRHGHPLKDRSKRGQGQRYWNIGNIGTLPINMQTGELARSLTPSYFYKPNSFGVILYFASPHRNVLNIGGLENMIERPYWQHIYRYANDNAGKFFK